MGHWRTQQLTIILTNRCNLKCEYCYPGNYKYGNLTANTQFAKCAIDDFLVKDRLGYLDKIRYFGIGEPTLEFPIMRELHEYAVAQCGKKNKTLRSEIQTNGIFSEEIARWIGENLSVICISCDGPPEVNNRLRPFIDGSPASHIIERNVKILREHNIAVGMRTTVTPLTNNPQALCRIVDYAYKTGFQYLYFHPMIPQQGPEIAYSDDKPYAVDALSFAEYYLEAWRYSQDLPIFVGSHFTINFDEPVQFYCRSCLPSPQLTLDKYISCCDEALYGDPKFGGARFKDLIIGEYLEQEDAIELYDDRIIALRQLRHVDQMNICSECEIRQNCAGGCLGEALFSTGNAFRKLSDNYCKAVKFLASVIPRNQGVDPYLHP